MSMDALHEGRNSGARRVKLISVMMSSLFLAFFVGGVDTSSSADEDGGDETARWEASAKI